MTDIILSLDDATPLRIDPSRTIFWTGAGISADPPSCLPLGSGLTDAYLETAMGPKWKQFVAIWNNHVPQIMNSVKNGEWSEPEPVGTFTEADIFDKAWQRPRLEYIIGEMNKLDKYFNSIHFTKPENQRLFARGESIAAIQRFSLVRPNLTHFRLADLSKAGARLVTANFDTGLEEASAKNVYHFHSSATDKPENFGATIVAMSRGLDEGFQDEMIRCFEKGFDIVFIGYGGVDFFDAEPFFRSLQGRTFPGKAIYLHYCANPGKREDAKRKEKAYAYLLEPFKNQYIAYGTTEELFHAIYDSYTPITVDKGDCGAFGAVKDYLKDLVDALEDKDTYYFLNTFRICSQLNISPGRLYPDWVNRLENLFSIWESDSPHTIEYMTVSDGQRNDNIMDDIYSNNCHDRELAKTGLKRRIAPYMRSWEKKHNNIMYVANKGYGFPLPRKTIRRYVDLTKQILEEKKTDEYSADISRATVMYLCGWQTKAVIWLYMKSHGFIKRRMLFLKACIDELMKYPFTRFRYRTHYLSLCRQAGYIDAVVNKSGYQGNLQEEWDICMQTPILYDAGQVLQSRIYQARFLGITDGGEKLKKIRKRILDLRENY